MGEGDLKCLISPSEVSAFIFLGLGHVFVIAKEIFDDAGAIRVRQVAKLTAGGQVRQQIAGGPD